MIVTSDQLRYALARLPNPDIYKADWFNAAVPPMMPSPEAQ